ncbi:MAG TPA: hypothetical protein VIB62_11370 [Actinomycetota bacterium]|jgi:hypothetical protein
MRRPRFALAAAATVGLMIVLSATSWAAPGNNGTVKVDGLPFSELPNNEPHVGCWFQIKFFGYDEGDLDATATLRLKPPTAGTGTDLTESVSIGEDPAGGGRDLDARILFTTDEVVAWLVANGPPEQHPHQGFHVKLIVHAEGSKGADTKHKVFWIRCHALPPHSS